MTTTTTAGRRSRLGLIWLALALGAFVLLAIPGPASAKDRNGDRIPDRWEKRHELSLEVNQSRLDQDRDGLRNRAEFLADVDPRDRDSDDDGVSDGDEQAGTIASFDPETGRLVIDLFGTDTVAGFVTGSTEIKCEDDGSSTSASASSSGPGHDGEDESGDDSGGDNSGPGSGDDDESDDNSGPGENSGPGSQGPGRHHGDDDGDDDRGGDRECSTAELVPGAVVEEAELKLEDGRATFREVELSGKAVAGGS